MGELTGIYAILMRELLSFWREKPRVIGAIVSPLIWLFLFGVGFGSTVSIEDQAYETFIFPGIIGMTILFSAVFYGTYLIWDKKIDFFKEVLVAPLSRMTIFTGKMLGGVVTTLFQIIIIVLLGFLIGIPLTLTSVLYLFLISSIIAVGLVSIGLIFGVYMQSFDAMTLIINFLVYPMFFLSGALYPLKNLPLWLEYLTKINPLTYGVDALRGVLLGSAQYPLVLDLAIISAFAVVMVALGTMSFKRLG